MYVFLDFRVVVIKKGEIVETKLHGESRVIQRCFDDNEDDDKGDDKNDAILPRKGIG